MGKLKTRLHIISAVLLMLVSSCVKDSSGVSSSEDRVDLVLSFSVPELSVTTRGLEDPWDEDLSDWTVWDRLTDGRDVYHLTIMLIEESTGDLVAFRNLYKGSEYNDGDNGNWNGSAVDYDAEFGHEFKATFNYDSPQGGRECEKLVRGKYMLITVANYDPYAYNDGSESFNYTGLTGAIGNSAVENPLEEYISAIETEFLRTEADGTKPAKEVGIEGFMDISGNGNHSDLFNNIWLFNIVLAQDTDSDGNLDNVAKKQPQPLSLVEHLDLHPGQNVIDCKLERTYVRVRIEVENNSGTNDLSVYDLNFCDWFTQRAVYLLDDPDNRERNYDLTYATGLGARKGALDPDTNDAIVKFSGTSESPVIIDEKSSKVIYDGYIFGSLLGTDPVSGQDSTYFYKLGLKYDGVEVITSISVNETPITAVEDFSDKYYLIQPVIRNNTSFIYENDQKQLYSNKNLESVKLILDEGGLSYVWHMEKKESAENAYDIQNMGSEHYVGEPDGANQPCNVITASYPYFIFSDMTNGMRLKFHDKDQYWNQFNFSDPSYGSGIGWWKNPDDDGAPFRLYQVDITKERADFNKPIIVETIDQETSHVSPVKNIKRNDFLNILVSVTYNGKKGDFEINSVLDWNTSDNEIEFH